MHKIQHVLIVSLGLLMGLAACTPGQGTSSDSSTSSSHISSSVSSDSSYPTSSSSSSSSSSSEGFNFNNAFQGDVSDIPYSDAEKLEDTEPRYYDGTYYVRVPNSDTILYEGQSYTSADDVAAYLQFFDELPVNYVTEDRRDEIASYNDLALVNGTFQNREGYLPYGYDYTEIDLRSGYSFYVGGVSRGTDRIVYGTNPRTGDVEVVFATYDHYDNFSEYLGYEGGWSESFGQSGDYSAPEVSDVVFVDDTAIFDWNYVG